MPRTTDSPVRVPTTWEPGMEPIYSSQGASGADLRAKLQESIGLAPGERALVPTGVRCAIPSGLEGQVRPRSGLALKKGVTVANAPGTIDCDYRGEIQVILINLGRETVYIERNERIAQLVICPVAQASFVFTGSLPDSQRGEGGFGSTGAK